MPPGKPSAVPASSKPSTPPAAPKVASASAAPKALSPRASVPPPPLPSAPLLTAPPEEMTYATAPPNFSDELDAAREALRNVDGNLPSQPPPQLPAQVPTAIGFGAMPMDDDEPLPPPGPLLAKSAAPAPKGSNAPPPVPGLFASHEDTGATAIYRGDLSHTLAIPVQPNVPPAPTSSVPAWEQRRDPMESTAPIPSMASAPPPPLRAAAPTDAMFAPAASPPRHRSQPAPSELNATQQGRAIRVETADSFEPQARPFVADQELVWRPGMSGMSGMSHPAMPPSPSEAPRGSQHPRSSRPDGGRQRSLAFSDNEFWDPQRPATQTMADTDALEAHLQRPKSRISLPLVIGGVLLVAAIAIVILAVVMS